MFEGVAQQLRPWAQHCGAQFERLMYRLAHIEQAIRDGAAESEFGDRIHRIPGNIPGVGSQSLGVVPLNQLWVVDYVWADAAGWQLTLGGVPRYGPGPNLGQSNPLVMLPGEEWSILVTAATNFGMQVTRQYLQQSPRAAHTGAGMPEGMTTADGPPLHELGRDALAFPALSR